MSTYLVVYYNGVAPTFSYAETLEEARSHALTLLTAQQSRSDDILSIVYATDDRVIYYGKRDKLIAKFNAIKYQTAYTESFGLFSLKPILNWIGLKLAGSTVW